MYDKTERENYFTSYPPAPDFESPSCASTDPEIFFPKSAREIKNGEWPKERQYNGGLNKRPPGKVLKATETAKAICKNCPHMSPCRDYAIENNLQFGIWGATTYRERMMLRRILGFSSTSVVVVVEEEFNGEETA